jgi:AraC-like DNA-binding protein
MNYVEYNDIFSRADIIPSAGIRDQLLLFDTFNGINPLEQLHYAIPTKIYQKISLYVLEGECKVIINGKEETVGKNMLATIMPENTLQIRFPDIEVQYVLIVTYPKLANEIYQETGITYSNARLSLRHFISTMSDQMLVDVLQIYNEIKRELNDGDYEFREAYLHAMLDALMIKNINIHQYNPVPLEGDSNSRQYDIYCKFLAMLNKQAIQHRSVQYYADQLGISSKYLSFVCASYSKKNASAWIDEAVIQKAKALILVHHYTLRETSQALHFPNVSSFSRYFKRVSNMTPKEFAKKEMA